ncbi:hypothetical protein N7472_002632 [Penicillium cf. griseofulvum]|uniref:Uncharacterized protein n=1 Tax=Penicillium cf. griseofulvum TaxID=2972120 RepID=A0A9W9MRL8_9EURO|nr:hypothetical protein N7472_002632 [Penicillium cf. griseofulvum]
MNQDRIATPQLMHKAKQESEEPDISRSTLQHQAGDAPVKTPDCEQVKEPLIKVEKHDPGLIAGLEDQKAATGVNQKPSFEDTEMPFDPEIDLVEPLAKVGKADSDLAASIGEQNSATGAKQEPFCEDAEMTLAAKIDPTESTITVEKSDPDLASIGEQKVLLAAKMIHITRTLTYHRLPTLTRMSRQLILTTLTVTPNLIRDLLQLKYEMNNALDVGEATDEKKRFYDAYQNVSGKIA